MESQNQSQITLYGDYGSQPSRAVYCFLKINKVPFQFKEVRVIKMEQYSQEFKKINPNAKVPALTDGNLNIFESHTIMRYIHESRNLADHWYPRTDFRKRAKIDEYLDWHHNGLRLGAGGYFFRKYVSPLLGKPIPEESIKESLHFLNKSLKLMENYWLKNENQIYLLGDELTIADLSAACELAQITVSPINNELKKYPKVAKWFARVMAIPEVKEIHDKILPLIKKGFSKFEEKSKL